MASKATWRALTTSGVLPQGRSSHGLVVIENAAYVYGGENKPRVPISNILHCLDLNTLKWTTCEPRDKTYVPEPVNAASMKVVGEKIFVFGGRTGIDMGQGDNNQMNVFDTKELKWRLVEPKGDVPCPRSYHAMTNGGKMLYVFGGCGAQGRMNDLHSFDTETDTWSKLPQSDVIAGRGGAGLAYCNGNVYVVGGFTGKEQNDVHRYNVESLSWSQIKFDAIFPPRSVFGLAVLNSTLVIIGGEVDPSDKGHAGAGNFSNQCYAWDTAGGTNSWKSLQLEGEVPQPRGWFPVAARGNSSIVIFGGNSESNERLGDVYEMNLN